MVYGVPLKNEVAARICELAEANGLFSHVYYDEKFYCERINPHTEYYMDYTKTPCCFTGKKNSVYLRESGFDPMKIVIFDSADRIHLIKEKVDEGFSEYVNTTLSQTTFLEVVDKTVSKGECLKFIAEYYGVPLDKTMSFGDATNDNSMLIAAGLGIAVKNAMAETLAVADYMTESAVDDGVAKAIEKFCFE